MLPVYDLTASPTQKRRNGSVTNLSELAASPETRKRRDSQNDAPEFDTAAYAARNPDVNKIVYHPQHHERYRWADAVMRRSGSPALHPTMSWGAATTVGCSPGRSTYKKGDDDVFSEQISVAR